VDSFDVQTWFRISHWIHDLLIRSHGNDKPGLPDQQEWRLASGLADRNDAPQAELFGFTVVQDIKPIFIAFEH
jgi:hypothetical protein